jgi:ATP-dependent DNA helicase PIF1
MQKVGNLTVMLESVDKCTDTSDELRFNPELIHTVTPKGFPPNTLMLKPGMPLMLLRNLNPKHGLCSGTRLIFNSVISNKLLNCPIVESQVVVLIPRITFVLLSDDSWPIDWQRKQFM